jgi:flagellar biosynthetic protein FliR
MFDAVSLVALQERFVVGGLFFVRITAMLTTAPFFDNAAVKVQTRIGLGVLLAMMMTTSFGNQQPPIQFDLIAISVIVLKEIAVGTIIGFVMNLMMMSARFAGSLADVELGFQTGAAFNLNIESSAILGELFALMSLMIFVLLNGHHALIETLFVSAKLIPLTQFHLPSDAMQSIVRAITIMLILGAKMGAPLLIALFITNLALALMSRVAPQINIFQLSYNVKTIVGLVLLMLTVPLIGALARHSLEVFQQETMRVLMSIAHHPA